ncbi:MAG: ATP-binding protein [Polyangiaceae bacterium]
MRRRSVARRIVASYLVLLVAFATTVGLALRDMRTAAVDAELLRGGLVPLQLSIGQALAEQNVLTAQLNHATSAKNPSDVREWIETARRTRPVTLAAARRATEKLAGGGVEAEKLRAEAVRELDALDQNAAADDYARLLDYLTVGDRDGATDVQSELVKREADGAQRLRGVKAKTEAAMERLSQEAARRERRALELLVSLSAFTLLVAAAITVYARRALRPLVEVTDRAKAVAAGDLTPRAARDDGSELGQLAVTFETMVGAIRDARAEIVKTERLATVGRMAAHITHEIRNPLSAIGLNLEMLESELPDTADAREQRELVAAIKNEAQRLSKLSEQYLSLARKPQPTLSPEAPGDLVEEILAFVRPELDRAKVVLSVDIEPDLPVLELDENLFRQALLNLVRNAREAMSDGGSLRVVVRAARPPDSLVEFVIEDTGPGIPEDVRASIFDPFFTTKQRGTGLGLAVTREILEAHRGQIRCEPREGGGTRFVLAIPVPAEATRAAPLSAPASS